MFDTMSIPFSGPRLTHSVYVASCALCIASHDQKLITPIQCWQSSAGGSAGFVLLLNCCALPAISFCWLMYVEHVWCVAAGTPTGPGDGVDEAE